MVNEFEGVLLAEVRYLQKTMNDKFGEKKGGRGRTAPKSRSPCSSISAHSGQSGDPLIFIIMLEDVRVLGVYLPQS